MRILLILIIATSLFSASCSSSVEDIIGGVPVSGAYTDLPEVRIYVPGNWSTNQDDAFPVLVILSGHSGGVWSTSRFSEWEEGAERHGVVLCFVRRDHTGWYEDPQSDDSRRIRRLLKGFSRQSWVKRDSVFLYGFSAGAIMGTSFLLENSTGNPDRLLFNGLFATSGGIGYRMEEYLPKHPNLEGIQPIPVYLYWGETESSHVGADVADQLRASGWEVQSTTHPGGHWIDPGHLSDVLNIIGDGVAGSYQS